MVEILSKCVCLTDLDENSLSNVSKDHEQSTEASNSSENFKIEISYLPRKIGYKDLKKKMINTFAIHPRKIKLISNATFAFVFLSSEDECINALKVINGHVWKGRQLYAKKASPARDSTKRKAVDKSVDGQSGAKTSKLEDCLPAETRLKNKVMPLFEMPYEQQLKLKEKASRKILKALSCAQQLKHNLPNMRSGNTGINFCLLGIKHVSELFGYRNKSEFTIGRSEDNSSVVVGYRYGLYKDGTDSVGEVTSISILPNALRNVAKLFQGYVANSKYAVFDPKTHSGHWRQLTVRGGTSHIDGLMNELYAEKTAITAFFTEREGKDAVVTTCFFRQCSAKSTDSTSEEPYELLFGDGYVYERLCGLYFRISPRSFFQVNHSGAEVLYGLIGDWCSISPTTTVLDICCGTGTIGLTMAKNALKVIGIESCREAIQDARVNAQLNGITNCTLICAKVQDVIHEITQNLDTQDLVAILDPPRAGLHSHVIKALRNCQHLRRIVYAACHPNGAQKNFVDLMRPTSKKTRGLPFRLVRACPVDMFPHTEHFELLMLFERIEMESIHCLTHASLDIQRDCCSKEKT